MIDRLLDAIDHYNRTVYPYECDVPCCACVHRLECIRHARTNGKRKTEDLPVQVQGMREMV